MTEETIDFSQPIAATLNLKKTQVLAVLELFEGGATIPFIARYRKDKTGDLDEVQIQQIQDESKRLKEFTERKILIEKSIAESGKMTEALQKELDKATTITQLEDIYLPYKPKRKNQSTNCQGKWPGTSISINITATSGLTCKRKLQNTLLKM